MLTSFLYRHLRLALAVAAVVAFALLLAACGSDANSDSKSVTLTTKQGNTVKKTVIPNSAYEVDRQRDIANIWLPLTNQDTAFTTVDYPSPAVMLAACEGKWIQIFGASVDYNPNSTAPTRVLTLKCVHDFGSRPQKVYFNPSGSSLDL